MTYLVADQSDPDMLHAQRSRHYVAVVVRSNCACHCSLHSHMCLWFQLVFVGSHFFVRVGLMGINHRQEYVQYMAV